MVLESLAPGLFQDISSLADGYYDLVRAPVTGAIDYIRSPLIQQPEGCLGLVLGVFASLFGSKEKVWKDVTGNEAGQALVELVTGSTRVYVFGAPYENPHPTPGMHD